MASERVVAGPIDGFSIVERKGRFHFNAPDGVRKRGLSANDVYTVEELIKQMRVNEAKPKQGNIFTEGT